VKELITAFKIETVYSKDEILETYLNTVPFLYNAYGVEMAARTYFGKSADQLDIARKRDAGRHAQGQQLLQPGAESERAVQRRNLVLAQMAALHMLSPQQLAQLQRPPRIDFEPQTAQPGPAPHFAVQLRKWLIAWADRNNYTSIRTVSSCARRSTRNCSRWPRALAQQTERCRRSPTARGAARPVAGCATTCFAASSGRAPTTAQRATPARRRGRAEAARRDRAFMRALRAQDARAGRLRRARPARRCDPRVGRQPRFRQRAVRSRRAGAAQPGSTFKPFVYGAAFADGMRPDDTFVDRPVEIPIGAHAQWRPTDAEPPTDAPMLRDALALRATASPRR
jgi:penicillin-binding protein 1A